MSTSGTTTTSTPRPPRKLGQEEYIHAERVRLLYRNGAYVLGATVVVAIALTIALADVVDRGIRFAWLAAYVAVSAIRALLLWLRKARPTLATHETWAALFALGSGAAGIAWGAAAILFFAPEQPGSVVLLTGVLVAVVAAAAQALSAFAPAFFLFAVPTILPLMAELALQNDPFYRPLGALGILYLIAISGFAYNSSRLIRDAIRVRFENLELVDLLSKEKAVAEQATLAKSRFLAAASHDLRQPLHALGLFHDALGPHVAPSGQPLLRRMRQSISALSGLFNSLLDVSRLDAGIVHPVNDHVRLAPIVAALADEFHPDANDKGIEFSAACDESIVVYCDAIMLERTLRNLIANAIRYTRRGKVQVECTADGQRCRIRVIDTGVGIAPEDHEAIFDEFHQLPHAEGMHAEGLGLGLSIVRRLSKLMGAELELHSTPGQGSEFVLAVPLGSAAGVAQRSIPRQLDLTGTRVLVVDDEADIRDSMCSMLAAWGCVPVAVDSATGALSAITSSSELPDIALVDYRLGNGANGIETIARLRAQAAEALPALLITGDTAPERLQEVEASGLRLLHKPVLPAELRTAIHQELLTRRETRASGVPPRAHRRFDS